MSRRLFWLVITVLLVPLFICKVLLGLSDKDKEYMNVGVAKPLPNVAWVEYLEPTKEHPRGSLKKYHYRYGILMINRKYIGHGRLRPGRLFAELNVAWPKFEGASKYYLSKKSQKLRIMFEINHDPERGFVDVYKAVYRDLDVSDEQDHQYEGFIGCKQDLDWVYLATDPELKIPQGTPLTILCSVRADRLLPSHEFGSKCRYVFLFDKALKAQVQFDKKLMKNFPQVHKDLLIFLESVREGN
ncbi:hypothetical protein [Microbulbifer epialgicus]|uniref:Uncharacterized protein n=1 Tax=Microbulbifer epialgicus TaxID=393907 RepID=A0ABV4P3Z0_9GAMM